MVYARLPRDKGKGKAEVATPQRSLNQNSRPRFNADFRSNKPPTALTRPAIVKPMTDYNTDEDSRTVILCSKCKGNVNTELKEKSYPPIMEQPTAATHQKVINAGQHQGVFDRLGPKVRVEETPSVRRRLDFDAPFYDEVYYIRNSSSSESLQSQKLSNLPNLKTSVGINITLRKVSTLHCPNPRNVGTKE
ncbi:hypothetical protein ACFX2A_023231 [Malus domestica]